MARKKRTTAKGPAGTASPMALARASPTSALRESDVLFRLMADHAPVLIWMSGTDKLCTWVNQPWLAFTGRTMEQELENGWSDGVHPDDRVRCLDTYATAFDARQPFTMDYRHRRHDGQWRWVLDHGVPLYGPGDEFTGYIGSCIDISDRRTSEQSLQESQDRLNAILNTAADAIITINQQGIIEWFNPAAEKMFGYAAAEAIGQDVSLLMPSPYRGEHARYLSEYLKTGEAKIIGIGREVVARRKDGSTFPADLSVSQVHDRTQWLFTGIIRDISERKELQAEVLRVAEEEQRRIGQELHDSVQQQLTGLGLIAQNLADAISANDARLAEEGGREELAQRAGRVAKGISDALNEVHTLARGLIPVEVDSSGLVSALAQLAAATSQLTIPAPQKSGQSERGSVPIKCTFHSDEPIEVADNMVATHLYRIAQEAVNNAVKHGRGERIEISIERTDHHLCVRVLDNGIGIDEKLFRGGIARTDRANGLGLRIMAYRAGLIGAALIVERMREGGTRVTCALPM